MDSIWANTPMPRFPTLAGIHRTDVLIIGGGMAGLLCAYFLKQAGVDCMLVEENRICSGISGNTTAKLTAQHGLLYGKLLRKYGYEKAGLYLECNQKAVESFRHLCDSFDCDFSDQDSYVYARENRRCLEEELDALRLLRYPASLSENLPLPFPTVGAVRFSRQGQFHPLKFAAGLCIGLPIYENTSVKEIQNRTVHTQYGSIHAEKIIVATHFPILNTHGSYFLKLYQQRSYVLGLENTEKFYGMYLDAEEYGLSFRYQGSTLLLGGGGHRTGKSGGGWQPLEQFTAEHYPQARESFRWAAQDCMSLDAIPYIGPYSRRTPGLYVATGFNKWGMTSSMVAAQLLTDQILDRYSPFSALFSPSRSILKPQLGLNILESTVNLLSLRPRRCPHMGCALRWNPQEHSWDCPCHGSRFDAQGIRLDNPATTDLKRE